MTAGIDVPGHALGHSHLCLRSPAKSVASMAGRSFEALQGRHDMPLATLLVNGSTTLVGVHHKQGQAD